MSPRERKLLIFFATAGFIVINFLAFNYAKSKKATIDQGLEVARLKLDTAEKVSASRAQIADEMEWLTKHEPTPAANQDVQTKLQQLCDDEAKSAGLTIKSQKPLPSEAKEGAHYHHAKFEFTVNGTEEALYRWFDRLNVPDQLRIASRVRIQPNAQDDTKIDCTATIEQCFVPLPATN